MPHKLRFAMIAWTLTLASCGQSNVIDPPSSDLISWQLVQPMEQLSAEWKDYPVDQILVADLNGDETAEVLILSRDLEHPEKDRIATFKREPDHSLTPLTAIKTIQDPVEMAVGSFDGDGIPDLAVVGYFDNGFYVFKGQGDGSFAEEPIFYPLPGHGNALQIDDVDGDSHADILVTTGGSGQPNVLHVYKGDGNGGFAKAGSYNSGIDSATSEFELCDLDGDGRKEAVFSALASSATVFYFPSQGEGQFAGTQILYAPSNPGAATMGSALRCRDLNDDGLADLLLTINFMGSDRPGKLLQFTNLGSSNFSEPKAIFEGDLPLGGGLDLGDFDWDGQADAVVTEPAQAYQLTANYDPKADFFYSPKKITPAGFEDGLGLPEGFSISTVTVTDINGDSYADILLGSREQGLVFLRTLVAIN